MGPVVVHLEKPQLPHCTSTAQIGYWSGRLRPSKFLATPVPPAIESISKRIEFRAWGFQIARFIGDIYVEASMSAATSASRRKDVDRDRMLLIWGSRNFHTVHLRLKSVTGAVDFGIPTFLQFPLFPRCRIDVKRARFCVWNSQISDFGGNVYLADHRVGRHVGVEGERYLLASAVTHKELCPK